MGFRFSLSKVLCDWQWAFVTNDDSPVEMMESPTRRLCWCMWGGCLSTGFPRTSAQCMFGIHVEDLWCCHNLSWLSAIASNTIAESYPSFDKEVLSVGRNPYFRLWSATLIFNGLPVQCIWLSSPWCRSCKCSHYGPMHGSIFMVFSMRKKFLDIIVAKNFPDSLRCA